MNRKRFEVRPRAHLKILAACRAAPRLALTHTLYPLSSKGVFLCAVSLWLFRHPGLTWSPNHWLDIARRMARREQNCPFSSTARWLTPAPGRHGPKNGQQPKPSWQGGEELPSRVQRRGGLTPQAPGAGAGASRFKDGLRREVVLAACNRKGRAARKSSTGFSPLPWTTRWSSARFCAGTGSASPLFYTLRRGGWCSRRKSKGLLEFPGVSL